MFVEFFSIIAARPDYMQDWPSCRGYMVESYSAWVGKKNDSYGLIFNKHLFFKYKMSHLISTILKQLRQPAGSSSGMSTTGGCPVESSQSRGCGIQGGTFFPSSWGGFHSQGAITSSQSATAFKCTFVVGFTPTGSTKGQPHDLSLINMASGSTSPSAVKSSVYLLTSSPVAVNMVLVAPTTTPAHSVVTSCMAPYNVLHDSIFPIVTKLKPNAWEQALMKAGILEEFFDIPAGLWNGLLCGLEDYLLSCTSIPKNHFTSKEDEDFIVMKYNAEMALNRILHGYNPQGLSSLIGHFHTAPLAVITHGGKCCVIVDHSFPRITTT